MSASDGEAPVRFYRGGEGPRAVIPRWVFGICTHDEYAACKQWLLDRCSQIVINVMTEPPVLPVDRRMKGKGQKEWTPEQREAFDEVVDTVARRLVPYALAGYAHKHDRARYHAELGGDVLKYATILVKQHVHTEARHLFRDAFDRPPEHHFEEGWTDFSDRDDEDEADD